MVVLVTVEHGVRSWDVAVDADLPLGELFPAVLAHCGVVLPGPGVLLDGHRRLDPDGPGLAGQGVVSGSRLRVAVG